MIGSLAIRVVGRKEIMKKITLIVDDEWYNAIVNLTNDVYEGETCKWVSVEVLPTVREMDGVS